MGCDIHPYPERNIGGKWQYQATANAPFDWRSYGMFGFLADVRNYSAVPPIAARRGLPTDASDFVREKLEDRHSVSWLSVKELVDFDYDQMMEDRRVTRNGDGGCTCATGEGEATTFREFLGRAFFDDLAQAQAEDVERIVFGFDS